MERFNGTLYALQCHWISKRNGDASRVCQFFGCSFGQYSSVCQEISLSFACGNQCGISGGSRDARGILWSQFFPLLAKCETLGTQAKTNERKRQRQTTQTQTKYGSPSRWATHAQVFPLNKKSFHSNFCWTLISENTHKTSHDVLFIIHGSTSSFTTATCLSNTKMNRIMIIWDTVHLH